MFIGFVIINCSWGGLGSNIFEQASINTMHNNYNAVIFAAAGNDNIEQAHYPSSYDNVISVTALGSNGSWNHWATYHESVDLGSPGENIRSTTISNYSSWDGTSMATPQVTGAIALMYAAAGEDVINESIIKILLILVFFEIFYKIIRLILII